MKIEVKTDNNCSEPQIVVVTDKMTDEVNMMIKKLSEETTQILAGFCNDAVEILEPSQIIRIYSEAGKVYAQTLSGIYMIRLCLYEMEDRLDKTFVRISDSEIINLKK